jgi:putative toxin-antitoxin system antitoxin component (TIGR02293 family)
MFQITTFNLPSRATLHRDMSDVLRKTRSFGIGTLPAIGDRSARAWIWSAPFGGIICDIMVNELKAVLDQLGGEAGVGRAVRTAEDLSAAIREGFPHEAVTALTSTGLSLQEIAGSLDLSLRSLQRRKSQGRLARYESDRLYRLARLVSLAANFLGDQKTAIGWLKRPNHALGGVAPLAIIDTELGARQVENVLGRIGYGGVS